MKIIKIKDYKEMSKKACEIILEDILKKPSLTIGFATGATPLGLYREMIRAYKKKEVDFSKIKSFNLDEYYPIEKNNKDSYYYYMFKNLFNKINIKNSNINLLNGNSKRIKKECDDYENKIKKNPIDIQILGVGVNGHIGFNEPGSSFSSKTRLVELAPETIGKKKRTKKALTMGVGTIRSAKKIIVLACGKNKEKAIRSLVKGKKDNGFPISFLKNHKNLVLIVDNKAAGLL